MSLSTVCVLLLVLTYLSSSSSFSDGDILYASATVQPVSRSTGVELSSKHTTNREYNTWEPSDWAYNAWDKEHLMKLFAGDYECVQSCGIRKIYTWYTDPVTQCDNHWVNKFYDHLCPCSPMRAPFGNETEFDLAQEQKRDDCSKTNILLGFCFIRPNCRERDIERCLKSDHRWGTDGPAYVGEYQGSELFGYPTGVLPVANGGTS